MELEEMMNNHQFEEVLENYYESVQNQKINSSKSKKYRKQLLKLLSVYYSCYNLGYYLNCIILWNNILDELNRTSIANKEKPVLYHMYFESLLYYCINREDISDYINLDVSKEIKRLSQHRLVVGNHDNNELLLIYKDYCNGKLPYYTLSFLLPYPPLFKEHTFDLSNCFPFISMNIKEKPRILENGDIHDTFTSIEFKVYGYTHQSPHWKGEHWANRERLPHIKKCLPILNMLYLYAGNSTDTFFPTICIEQISTTTIHQFTYDDKIVKYSIGTDFNSQWVGLNIPNHEYTQEELHQLNEWIVQSYGSECFVSLFQQAKNNVSAGLYVESFLLLCSCSESMIYYWCKRLCKSLGVLDMYDEFSKRKVSACDSCQLFANSDEEEKHHIGMEPSLYQHIKFIVKECSLSKNQERELNKMISKVRNDQLRNDVVHGRTNTVSLSVVKQSIDTLMKLQEFFVNIEKQVNEKLIQ